MIGILALVLGCTTHTDNLESAGLGELELTRLDPASGSTAGGTVVSATGTGFEGDVLVKVGSEPCADLTVTASTTLVCTTPPGQVGEATLQVTRPSDGAVASIPFTFTTGSDGTDGTGDDGDGGSTDGEGDGTDDPWPAVDYRHLQWPCSLTGVAGAQSDTVYVRVYESGVTEQTGAGPGLQVDVGWGDASEPPDAWTWTAAGFNTDVAGLDAGALDNDEWMGAFTLPSAGSYVYAGRASLDGENWLVCDLGDACGGVGSSDGTTSESMGAMTVK